MLLKILSVIVPFGLGIILKALLDLNLGCFVVKYFYWIPIRWLFRTKPIVISGIWNQYWENTNSERYKEKIGRNSTLVIKQFGKYIYGEFRTNNDENYFLFCEVKERNIIGKWGDKKSDFGYYGACQLRIINAVEIEGLWFGHSHNQPNIINSDKWIWKK